MKDPQLYQSHGDHIGAIMPTDLFINKYLRNVISESKIKERVTTQATTEHVDNEPTGIISLSYGDGEFGLLTIFADNPHSDCKDFVSVYPCLLDNSGFNTIDTKIERVVEWNNHIEATVYASIGDFKFAFFATDYYSHKNQYQEGRTLHVSYAALGINVKRAQEGFSFEGKDAVEWLSKLGEKPEYDEDGNVKPVNFSTEKLVAFLNLDDKCPDEGEFQSPTLWCDELSLLGIDFYKTTIILHRENDADDESSQISVPLYFRKSFVPDFDDDLPLSGWLWLTGSVNTRALKNNAENLNELGDMASNITAGLNEFDYKNASDLKEVSQLFSELKIKDGYVLDYFEAGDDMGARCIPYCHKINKAGVSTRVPYNKIEEFVPVLEFFEVPFTEEGILQAWLLDNLSIFMHKLWHGLYGNRDFVFTDEDFENLKENVTNIDVANALQAIEPESIYPSVKIGRNAALLTLAYWSNWRGLIKESVTAERDGESVIFGTPETVTLVKYNCGIKF